MYAAVHCKMSARKGRVFLRRSLSLTGYMHRVPCFPEDNNLEDDIVAPVVNERSCADGNDDLHDDSDEEQTIESTVTHTAARRACRSRTGALFHGTGI